MENYGNIIWQSCGRTDPGKKRKHNQDAMLNKPGSGLWVVADGMGGHQSGEIASRWVVDGLAELGDGGTLNERIEKLTGRLIKINADLCGYADSMGEGCITGTTVVALLAKGLQAGVVWAGDSRLYRYRQGQLQQLSRDHTLLNELMQSGMNEEMAGQLVGANVITKAVGGQDKLDLDIIRFDAECGDRYLLCSDGLDKELSDDEIAGLMGAEEYRRIADELMDTALSRDGSDNITVIVCEVAGGAVSGWKYSSPEIAL